MKFIFKTEASGATTYRSGSQKKTCDPVHLHGVTSQLCNERLFRKSCCRLWEILEYLEILVDQHSSALTFFHEGICMKKHGQQ